MNDQHWYTVRTVQDQYRVVKFDFLFSVENTYAILGNFCSCPAGSRRDHICKHKLMLWDFIRHKRVNRGWFFCWDTKQWQYPATEEYQALANRRAK